ncbi:VRR-NUC domain-containing protein [Vibrio superstes]|uniref:phosphodiesterase I n=1 Tax=Vibrio superstes NBRC 103154 TaxID=1219062 RepID=A0A511QRD2_9VIBR|nr:VRR-NUC domain-containing protein [Vibrio superstes]GEM79881.1 nuclease [Vibrio superstes NBRC 103154]
MQQMELPEGYYHRNFNALIEHAQNHYSDLLHREELQWIKDYYALDREAQRLLVRLYSRKGEWFRSDKLHYAEIPDLDRAFEQLVRLSFISIPDAIDTEVLCRSILTKPEVLKLFPQLGKSLSKSNLVQQAAEECEEIATDQLDFTLVHLEYSAFLDTLTTLFFANARQDLSQFVLSDLGLHQFEQYSLSKELRFFNRRVEVEQLLSLAQVSDRYYQMEKSASKTDKIETLSALLDAMPVNIEHSYVTRRHQRLINNIARDLERLEDFDKAIQLFEQSTLAPSRERRVRILIKRDRLSEAKSLVEQMLEAPQDEPEHEVAQRLHQQLNRKLGIKTARVSKPTIASYHIELDLTAQRVESAVVHHLEQTGWQAYFLENTFLTGLFGLAFWDVIYAPIEGAFLNAYQIGPKDLYTPEFTEKRQPLIDTRKEELQHLGFAELERVYQCKQGLTNPFVHWPMFDLTVLQHAKHCFRMKELLGLFEIILADVRSFRTGMPDLIAFKNNDYRWIEVKGPGDKLQDNQIRWFKQFSNLGIKAEVCYVNH